MADSFLKVEFGFAAIENKDRFTHVFDLLKEIENFNVSEVEARLNLDPSQLTRKDVNENSLLHCACNLGNVKAVKLLLNFNIQMFELNLQFKTAFHLAIEHRNISCLNLLLEHAKSKMCDQQWQVFLNEITIEATNCGYTLDKETQLSSTFRVRN